MIRFLCIAGLLFSQTNLQAQKQDVIDASWSIIKVDIARNADYLSDLEKDVVKHINMLRVNPSKYAEVFLEYKVAFFDTDGKLYKPENRVYEEGVSALKECIDVLKNTQPLNPLSPLPGLSKAAAYHTKHQGQTNKIGHNSPNGWTPSDRIRKHERTPISYTGENIDYGNNKAVDIIIHLIVDDGVLNRGHRKNLLNPEFINVGVSCGPHGYYRYMCTMDFSKP